MPVLLPVPSSAEAGCEQLSVTCGPALAAGGAMSASTCTLNEALQLLAVLVTNRVYTPDWLTVAVAVLPPDTMLPVTVPHWYSKVGPLEEPAELSVICCTVQVTIPEGVASAVGRSELLATAAVAVLVHPLALLVTTRV